LGIIIIFIYKIDNS